MREEQASSDLFELQGHYIQVSVEEIVAVLDPVRATWDERLEQLTLTMKDWEHLMRAQDAGVDLDESGSESGNNELAESRTAASRGIRGAEARRPAEKMQTWAA